MCVQGAFLSFGDRLLDRDKFFFENGKLHALFARESRFFSVMTWQLLIKRGAGKCPMGVYISNKTSKPGPVAFCEIEI